MIELTLVACLLDAQDKCREERIYLELQTTMQCMMVSQIEVVKFIESHPKYFIKRWTCSASKHNDI